MPTDLKQINKQTYQHQRQRGDKCLNQIKTILAPYLITTAPDSKDRKHSTDLVCNQADISVRVRASKWADLAAGEFTVRAHVYSGGITEYVKIMSGNADYCFYGFYSDSSETSIDKWSIIDWSVFRLFAESDKVLATRKEIQNTHGITGFYAYQIDSFPADLVIASNHICVQNPNGTELSEKVNKLSDPWEVYT